MNASVILNVEESESVINICYSEKVYKNDLHKLYCLYKLDRYIEEMR